jgi:hypothetical protein
MLKLCSTYHWELKQVISSRQKEGNHLFVGEVSARFWCHRDKPSFVKGQSFCLNIRSDGTVDLGYDSELHEQLREFLAKASVSTIPTNKLGSGIR